MNRCEDFFLLATTMRGDQKTMRERFRFLTKRPRTKWYILAVLLLVLAVAGICVFGGKSNRMDAGLAAAFSQAVLDANTSGRKEIVFQAEAHEILQVARQGDQVTVYALSFYQGYAYDDAGGLRHVEGSSMPIAVSFRHSADGSYGLLEYWVPGDGDRYATSIREKFPLLFTGRAIGLNGAAQRQADCQAQAAAWLAEQTNAATMTEAKAIGLFHQAEAACAWFYGRNGVSLAEGRKELYGNAYYPVTDERFSTLAELRQYLDTLFTADLTEGLLARKASSEAPVFAESDGRLYLFGGYAAQLGYEIGQRDFVFTLDDADHAALELTYTADPWGDGSYRIDARYNLSRDEAGAWRFDWFSLPLDLLLEQAEYSLFVDGQPLMLGRQSAVFPWGYALNEIDRTLWQGDGFSCFRVVCEENLILSGLRLDGAADLTNCSLLEMITVNPTQQTYRHIGCGMGEAELLATYPQLTYLDGSSYDQTELLSEVGQTPTAVTLGAALTQSPDYGYVYAPVDGSKQTCSIVFWIKNGVITVIMVNDGMDGRVY